MLRYIFLVLTILYLPVGARGQTIEDPALNQLLQPITAQSLRCWFDQDADNMQTSGEITGTGMFDVSSLSDGLHTLNCQIVGSDGNFYGLSSQVFLKINAADVFPNVTAEGVSLKYWFDEDDANIHVSDGQSGAYMLDVSSLNNGLHTLHYMIVGADGKVYSLASDVFIKMEGIMNDDVINKNVSPKGIAYWFDEDEDNMKSSNSLSGIYSLDISSLSAGIHSIHYYVIGADGVPYGLTSAVFLKSEEEFANHQPNTITKYQYWLNDDNTTTKTVELGQPANPCQLLALLPVQKMPIRSSSFQFDITDGKPTIYAKNDFHIRFHDARGYFTDTEKTFVDYSVKQTITDVKLLESGVRETAAKPGKDSFAWYKLDAEPGDSLQFKLDRAATIQLFSPSGKEVYAASGAYSIKFGGCHAAEDGTYYLALHDVTATQGTTISIDYNHIDKYAVLRQDVKVVGNGGCSTITFEGNGFRDLYAVDLYNEAGDTIRHIDIGHESDATTTVTFDFEDAAIGMYHGVFRFTGEDKNVANVVTVEPFIPTELATSIRYNVIFLRGTKTPHEITVGNKGNTSAYRVPVSIIVRGKPGAIAQITEKNPPKSNLAETIEWDELSETEAAALRASITAIESNPVSAYYETLDNQGDIAEQFYVIQKFIDIPPRSEVTISIMTLSTDDIFVSYNVPDSHPTVSTSKVVNKTPNNWYCDGGKNIVDCIMGGVTTVSNMIVSATDNIPGGQAEAFKLKLVNCGIQLLGTANDIIGNALCSSDTQPLDNPWEFLKFANQNFSAVSTITKCAEPFIPKNSFLNAINKVADNQWVDLLSTSISIFSTLESCANMIKDQMAKNKNVTSQAVASLDPNDIYGYQAESGSKAVKDGLRDVYYTIEFENDPEFATAAAHDIYLADTLDAARFDLSTFEPTRIKIGEKTAELSGDKDFVTTVDMRPEINAIAQVEGTFDEETGIARWHISSLDPMTMEPTDDPMEGVLPVNNGGNGIGEVSYNISLKEGLEHGTEIPNRAGIVFDNNETIMTPTWTNVIDRMAPESHITKVEQLNDTTATVSIEAADELSGAWRYDVYVQYGEGAPWWKAAENVPVDTTASVRIYDGINHGFYVVTTDMAGNVEEKDAVRESTLDVPAIVVAGDINGDKRVDSGDVMAVYSAMAGIAGEELKAKADVNGDGRIDSGDVMAIYQLMAGRLQLPKRIIKQP